MRCSGGSRLHSRKGFGTQLVGEKAIEYHLSFNDGTFTFVLVQVRAVAAVKVRYRFMCCFV